MEVEFIGTGPVAWLAWLGAAVMIYGCVVGSVGYVRNIRAADKTKASQSLIQFVLSLFGLIAVLLIQRYQLLV